VVVFSISTEATEATGAIVLTGAKVGFAVSLIAGAGVSESSLSSSGCTTVIISGVDVVASVGDDVCVPIVGIAEVSGAMVVSELFEGETVTSAVGVSVVKSPISTGFVVSAELVVSTMFVASAWSVVVTDSVVVAGAIVATGTIVGIATEVSAKGVSCVVVF
jgi:hypothetical protein